MLLLKNIRELVQVREPDVLFVAGKEMQQVQTVNDAFLLIHDGIIMDYGPMDKLSDMSSGGDHISEVDCSGRMVFPSYCDSHTHIVFPAARDQEFVDKIRGLSYEEIARRGGGILHSSELLHRMPAEELYNKAINRINEVMQLGTGAIEIKSGYGLNTEDELKMLRVIRQIKETMPVTVRSSFLGAHSVPLRFRGKQSDYVKVIVEEMIPEVARQGLADFVDVFCDRGFFTPEETSLILEAASHHGIRGKIHANELDFSGGIQVAVKHKALSVDHLEYTGDEEIRCLKGSGTMPTVLPGAAFFLNLPLAPVRKMIDAGLPVAMASDYNPGSSPSGNMNFIASLGCIKYKMLPEEAINAVTLNAAYAMGLENKQGSITKGKKANVFITKKMESYNYIPYFFGSNLIETVILNGKIQSFS